MMPRPGNESQGRDDRNLDLPFVALGSARLPASALGEQPGALMIELALDDLGGKIVEVATNIPLPGYNGMLRRLLAGRGLDEIDAAAGQISEHCCGLLVKPTIAALANAAAHMRRQVAGAS